MRQFPQSTLDTLARGGIVVCANARAARALGGLYARHARAAFGRDAWETPRVFDARQWLHAQWRELLLTGEEERALLTPLQEEVLWGEVVRPAVERRSLIAPAEVAHLAMSAYARLHAYGMAGRLRPDTAGGAPWDHAGSEPELFRAWALTFERRRERNGWLSEAQLPWALAEAWRAGRLSAPAAIEWNGFDRLTPADSAMRDALARAGCEQSDLAWGMRGSERLLAAASASDELEACAEWARAKLAERPDSAIGILVPDLEAVRAELDRVLGRVFSPPDAGRVLSAARPTYEFTLGLPLARTPVVAAAVTLLTWCAQPLEQAAMTWLLTCGFFGAPQDAAMLAEADVKVRTKLSVPELEIADALERLSRFAGPSGGNWAVANWVRRMRHAFEELRPLRGKQRSCAPWVATIDALLAAAGWPGDGPLDSVDYQIRERWRRALDEISALGPEERRYDYAEFLRLLRSHLNASTFSPESAGAPVTVSGIFESSGSSFDSIWVLGATDTAWPARSRMHPLLPVWLQKQFSMPGAGAEQDGLLAGVIFDRLRDSAADLIFSYAREGSEGAQRPCALLAHLDEGPIARAASAPAADLESFADEMAMPWPGGRAAGGEEVLKRQSACPFQAFAAKRLGAKELPSLEAGLDAREQGSVVHKVLAGVWMDARMRHRDALRDAIESGKLAELVDEHTAAALASHAQAATTAWERNYLRLERERVAALAAQWLTYEAGREYFEVERCESEQAIVIEGLELSVRMDRIDRIGRDGEDGGRVLIDYKTGEVKRAMWLGERPEEPQLPIYAIGGRIADLRDVLFAQVRAGGTKFVGALDDDGRSIFPANAPRADAAEDFLEMRAGWAEVLGKLAREFQTGLATVTPKEFPATCKFCAFGGLCRVADSSAQSFEQEEDEL